MNKRTNAIKVLGKLLESGFKTERDITSMSIDKMLTIGGITVRDITLINELQKAIKSGKVVSFLSGEGEG